MVSEDWANPFFGQGVERNCRFYSETHDCVFEETLLSINLVALILSFIGSVVGLWGIVKIGWRKNERWKITEKVAAFFTFYFIFRLAFLIALVGRILNQHMAILMVLQNSCWIFVLAGCVIYIESLMTIIPTRRNTRGSNSSNSDKNRNTHIYTTLIIVITASILTVFGFLDGWSRERGEYDDELLFHRILKVIYAIISYVASWFIWKHGRKLHKLAKNRANVMEQFPQRGRNLTPLVIAPMLESSPDTKEIDFSTSITGQQNAKQLRHSQFRLDTINWAILIGGTAFGSFALLYAAILPEVVTRPGLNLLFHLLLNVLTTLIFLLMMIILVFSVTYQRELERQKAEAYQKTANDGTCPYSYNDNLSICTRNTLDMVEASRLSAAIATLQAEIRLEPLMVVEHSLAPATQPRQFDSLNARDSLTPSSSRRVRDDWMYCALQARDSIAK